MVRSILVLPEHLDSSIAKCEKNKKKENGQIYVSDMCSVCVLAEAAGVGEVHYSNYGSSTLVFIYDHKTWSVDDDGKRLVQMFDSMIYSLPLDGQIQTREDILALLPMTVKCYK